MKFLLDAHLPLALKSWLKKSGFDVVHTLDLPARNQTDDMEILNLSMQEERIVVSKDSDFYDHFLLLGQPYKLLIISTGNVVNRDLLRLFELNIEQIEALLTVHKVIEVDFSGIIVHH